MAQQPNFFDDLKGLPDKEQAEKYIKEQELQGNRIDYLVHKVFEQSEEGKELLAIWHDSLILVPTADDGMDSVAIGIREGMKRFIRGIILTIRRVENG